MLLGEDLEYGERVLSSLSNMSNSDPDPSASVLPSHVTFPVILSAESDVGAPGGDPAAITLYFLLL